MAESFSASELTTALNEVAAWGLRTTEPYQVLPAQFSPPNEARAKVELLEEGDSAVIGVSEKGWKICLRSVVDFDRLPSDSAAKDEQSFETLDNLLAYLSPEFERKRMDLLMQKLGAISVERSGAEQGEEEA